MATTGSIVSRAQLEIGDIATPFVSSSTGDGITPTFELSRQHADPNSISVTVAGIPMGQGTDYTIDQDTGLVTFAVPPAFGVPVQAIGIGYTFFSPAEWNQFVTTALQQHLLGRTDPFGFQMTLSTLPPVEEYLVVLLVTIEALWVLHTSAAFDIDISTPEGVHIPRSERFQQLQTIITTRKAQYDQLAQALNVGLSRIEQFDLRRVSRQTNKLVPLYKAQEIEDNRPPQRAFVRIDTKGGAINQVVVEPTRLDITGYANNALSVTVSGLGNLTGLTVRAHVRPYPGNLSSLATMTLVINDVTNGVVTVSLTGQQTWYIPANCFWDLETVDAVSNVVTLVQGTVYIQRQGQP